MKSKSFAWAVMGVMTAGLTVPEINFAQVKVCQRNGQTGVQECRIVQGGAEGDNAERNQREEARKAEAARERREAELAGERAAREAAQRRLLGTWYLNGDRGKPCQIFFNGGGFEARNERGETTRLEYRGHPNGSMFMFIRASDWGDLRGEMRHQSIQWANGTTWRR